MDVRPKRKAFTLVELLVVMAIIALLVAIAVPAIGRARATARSAQDQSNLRQIGIALIQFSDLDPATRFCTGAIDFQRDGCPDSWGWMADVVNMGACRPADLLNPAGDLRGIETMNIMLGAAGDTEATDGGLTKRLGDGSCGLDATWSESQSKWTGMFAGTASGSAARADFLARNMVAKGYNTNYVASWHLVRGSIRLVKGSGSTESWSFASASGDAEGRAGTTGPLTRRAVDNGMISSSNIPLLGDAARGPLETAILEQDIKQDPANYYDPPCPDQEVIVYIEAGFLASSYNRGPAAYDSATDSLVRLSGGTDVTAQVQCERGDKLCESADTSVTNHGWLQDTHLWAPVHGKHCNILMADGSVKEFTDQNNDGFLNPGFGDDPVELPKAEIYSGVFLEAIRLTP